MADRRVRHGLQEVTSVCFVCDQDEDRVDPILLQCVYAHEVWASILAVVGMEEGPVPTPSYGLVNWWEARRCTRARKHEFDSMVVLVCSELWKQHNCCVFGRLHGGLNP